MNALQKKDSPAAKPRRRVLIVEDNLDGARMLAKLIFTMGHEVDYAINGYAALRLAERFQPDIVIVDLALPDITGWAVARALRQKPGLEGVRIYATTGQYGEAARERSLAAGCDGHFVKPFDPAVLNKLLS
jgi:CheY-like chemotaxis protein